MFIFRRWNVNDMMWMSLKEIILQVVDWWPLVLLIFCSQWGRGEPVFCTYRGHLPYWQHICGVKKIFWLLSYDVCVCVCVLAHLLKPQRLSEILVCEDALDDARETASFHPFVLKGMWNAVREKHFSNLDLHFNSPHIDWPDLHVLSTNWWHVPLLVASVFKG